jgi:hypothetical protein
MYDGPKRPAREMAELHYPEPPQPDVALMNAPDRDEWRESQRSYLPGIFALRIDQIDGRKTSGEGIYEMLPGTHDLLLKYNDIYITSASHFGKSWSFSGHKKTRFAKVQFEAERGHVYGAAQWNARVFDSTDKFRLEGACNLYWAVTYRIFDASGQEVTEGHPIPAVAPRIPLRIFDATKERYVKQKEELLEMDH